MKQALALTMALLASLNCVGPTSAQEVLSPQQAETRLRGCLQSGSAGAPRTGLYASVAAVRALCKPQIDRVAEDRVAAATQGLTDEDAERAEKRVVRQLNDEIAYAIANFTGLKTL